MEFIGILLWSTIILARHFLFIKAKFSKRDFYKKNTNKTLLVFKRTLIVKTPILCLFLEVKRWDTNFETHIIQQKQHFILTLKLRQCTLLITFNSQLCLLGIIHIVKI